MLLAVFVSCLFAVVIGRLGSFLCFCRPSWRLLAVLVCHCCCFVVGHFLAALVNHFCCFVALLAVLLAVLAQTFFGFQFLIGALVNIQSSASSNSTVKRYVYCRLIIRSKYG